MTLAIKVTYDKAKLKRIEQMLKDHPNVLRRIVPRGINRTAVGARAQAAREIQPKANLAIGAIKKSIAQRKATRDRWSGEIIVSPKRIPLIKFKGTRQGRKGVSYAVQKSQRQLAQGAFIRSMGSGHKGVFARKWAAGGKPVAGRDGVSIEGRKRVARLPILELKGPSLAQVVKDAPAIIQRVQRDSQQRLEKEITHNAEREIARRMPK